MSLPLCFCGPAMPANVRGQNGRQPPLYVLAAQDAPQAREIEWYIYQNCGPMSGYPQVRNGSTGAIFGSKGLVSFALFSGISGSGVLDRWDAERLVTTLIYIKLTHR
ncbi:hypothetical protein [Bradyrhizobium sp. S3.2.12]|uniref:hypothetical protein n=1 Tax=Bradyrhizobium sp. S3.2.12 TaxID=3156387 RepID=UPI00339433B8